MDTKYLHSFISVVDCGSFAEAARRLNLTSAALAARIKALEEDIGTTLIMRAGRNVKPTDAGMKIVDRARSILRDTRDIRAIANNDEPLGELRLGVATSTLAALTPMLLRKIYARYPRMSVFIESGASSSLEERTVSRHLDAAIMVEPVYATAKGFEWQLIKKETLVVLAPGRLGNEDPFKLLAEQPFLRFDRSLRGGQIAEQYLRKHRIVPNERLEIDTLITIAHLVSDGIGVALVPDWAPEWVESLGISRLALPNDAPARNMGIFWDTRGTHAGIISMILEEAGSIF
ncbi:LysR family transcriptional regulator [Paracandidimonas soli]|uniref:DNA-binding transcriptional LysR family regulator n=1 Tax=Paracandidimonas soli TaxID=1917182 RepID=A0A4R3UQT8_9BURK|nr:LysR family transcriptional regulator [Paracandidimonas soli]TCU93027.1 DNA-binding transcriptional LysR family regulator [Paracandidimonas soli]